MGRNGLARIKVIGVGGGGGNAVDRMKKAKVKDVELIIVNTDAQVLSILEADRTVQIGAKLTAGLGAGGNPEVGRKAAEESEAELAELMEDTDMVFLTVGMGGGTGTGASPVIARLAREAGVLTVAIVTKPFSFEGRLRAERARKGIEELRQYVDTLIAIPNDRLLKVAPPDVPLVKAFELADDILRQGVQGISDLITTPGMINLDFADVEATMRNAGTALMGIGEGEGENRTRDAARNAITSPLLEGSIEGAQRLILNITGGPDLSLEEVTEAASLVRDTLSDDADIFFGAVVREGYDRVRITVIATGFKEREELSQEEKLERGLDVLEDDEDEIIEKVERSIRQAHADDWDIPTFLRKRKND
ncbi:MAG: cell division protein FtsZ [Candidatus Bipolaricaulota bacterium]|nr:cell division protein FtsZ [Candidatus Bipolaricaulota bacterium]